MLAQPSDELLDERRMLLIEKPIEPLALPSKPNVDLGAQRVGDGLKRGDR